MCQSGKIYISYPLNVAYYIGAYRIKSELENLIKNNMLNCMSLVKNKRK